MSVQNKKTDNSENDRIILGMVMLQNEYSFNLDSFLEDYNSNYGDSMGKPEGDSFSATFSVGGELIAMGHMPVPVPAQDLERTAKYAYNWPTAVEETKAHKSHLIVSMLPGSQEPLVRFKIFTQALCSLLRTTDSIGIYMGEQSLLIPREDYLQEAAHMSDDYLPLNLWIYFGLRSGNSRNSGYTYGLKGLNKEEMEVVNSSKSLEDIRAFLFNIAHYVLEYDVTFQDGETVGLSEEEVIAITYSGGKLVEGSTFKLAY
ncbi:DUF4261 domain-containing protein [Paraflavisolibacter sp. H34]|uniref:DUF4261 domain-containing protein n=1 Tax=Huijunlia imazamoxiresistens TaxID=3127457 RepID=UPI00301ADC39